MNAHKSQPSTAIGRIDDRVLISFAIIGVCLLLLPAIAPVATGGSPGYYLTSKYLTSDDPDTSIRDDGAAAGTAGSAMTAAGAFAVNTASATSAVYGGAIVATGGVGLAVSGGVLLG